MDLEYDRKMPVAAIFLREYFNARDIKRRGANNFKTIAKYTISNISSINLYSISVSIQCL